MRELTLTKGAVTLVDDEDFDELNNNKWCLSTNGYAHRSFDLNRKRTHLYLHRVIAKPSQGMEVDHINGDKLDNRKCNLRVCTSSQNKCNRVTRKKTVSGFKGVRRSGTTSKWKAQINKDGVAYNLGLFDDPAAAFEAYKEKAKELHGEYAKF